MNVIALRNCVRTNGICLCLEIEQVSNNFVEKDFRKSMGVKYGLMDFKIRTAQIPTLLETF